MVDETQALLLSIGVETTCLVGLGRMRGWMPAREAWAWLLAGVAATLVTHPFAWEFSITHTPTLTPEGKALRIEGAVVLVEALIYGLTLRLRPLRALAVSLVANAGSYGLGLLL